MGRAWSLGFTILLVAANSTHVQAASDLLELKRNQLKEAGFTCLGIRG